jgi:hypothetical protein
MRGTLHAVTRGGLGGPFEAPHPNNAAERHDEEEGGEGGVAPEEDETGPEGARLPDARIGEAKRPVLAAQDVRHEPIPRRGVPPAHLGGIVTAHHEEQVRQKAERNRRREARQETRRGGAAAAQIEEVEAEGNAEEHERVMVRKAEPEPEGSQVQRLRGGSARRLALECTAHREVHESRHEEVVEGKHFRHDRVGPHEGREREGARGEHARRPRPRPQDDGAAQDHGGGRVAERGEQADPPRDAAERHQRRHLGEQRIERIAGRVRDADVVRDRDELAAVAPRHGVGEREHVGGERRDPAQRRRDHVGPPLSRRWKRSVLWGVRGGRRAPPVSDTTRGSARRVAARHAVREKLSSP